MKNLKEAPIAKSASKGLFLQELKAKLRVLVLFLMLSGIAMNVSATETVATASRAEARATAIKERVNQIKAMDFSQMSKAERKNIRHELKDMNKELRDPTFIYIGGGTLLLIIILLLILL